MCVHEPEPRLHHSSDGGGGGGGGGGNNNSQASGSSRPPPPPRIPPPQKGVRSPWRPRAQPTRGPRPHHSPALREKKKECLRPPAPGPPAAPAPPAARRGETPSPRLPGPKVRFIYLFPVEDVGAGAAGWLEGAFSVEADRGGREGARERARGAGHGSAEESDAHGAAAQALFSGRWLGLRWKLVSL